MRATTSLFQHALRLTLFTRPNCGLCDEAKHVLTKIRPKRNFDYDEIDVMIAGQGKWKDLYEFDTPVVHIDKTQGRTTDFETTAKAKKLMHRFTNPEMLIAMDEVEKDQ